MAKKKAKRKVGGHKGIRPEDGKQFSSEYQPAEKWTEEKALKLADDLIEWLRDKDKVTGDDKGNIFFEYFLVVENDYYSGLITYLKNKFSSFSKRLEQAKKIQEVKLKVFGTADMLNSSMTKFILINEHGFGSEQKEDKESKEEDKGFTIRIVKND